MTEIKLNEWRWGVVPELHPDACVRLGGFDHADPTHKSGWAKAESLNDRVERWYAVLSLGPPTMPDPELMLPEGWNVLYDDGKDDRRGWTMRLFKGGLGFGSKIEVTSPTRRECVEEINRILGGEK